MCKCHKRCLVSIYGAETECIASYTIQSQFTSHQIKSLDYFNFIEQVCWLQGIRYNALLLSGVHIMYNILYSVKLDGWSLPFHIFNFCECVYSQLYSWAYFAGLIFTVSGSSMKTVENWTPTLYIVLKSFLVWTSHYLIVGNFWGAQF